MLAKHAVIFSPGCAPQVKVLRDSEKTDADGNLKSKGIAFVEFVEHQHALVALRQLNNNPKTFTKERRPIIEFAVENVKVLKKREEQVSKQQKAGKQLRGRGNHPESAKPRSIQDTDAEPKVNGKGPDSKRRAVKRHNLEGGDDGEAAAAGQQAGTKRQRKQPAAANGHKDDGGNLTRRPSASDSAKQAASQAKRPAPNAAKGKPAGAAGKKDGAPRKQANSAREQSMKEEQAVQMRKRKQDDFVDQLAGGRAVENKQQHKKSRKQETERTDNLDSIVQEYKARLFGSSGSAKKTPSKANAGSAAAAMRRWFD